MLSSENPPPDLPCSCEISQLKLKGSDERASDNNQHQLVDEEVDLFKSGLDDNNISPLPNFSLRDYVFSTRDRDIKNNWPFSQKNLQLCLKYGLNDVLPPFQSPDPLRSPSIVQHAAENLSHSDGKLSKLSNHTVAQKLAVDIKNINSGGSEKDKEFPSTTASQSCSDIKSVPPLESPPGNPEFTVRASKKVVSNIQNTVKKCRLIVKSNNTAEQKSNGDLAVDTTLISETMASKVCPVCKMFISSSNTTLNAHIDQCISGESTVKWTTNSKVIKHRIKPRKTRLMVDIYETALHCTLEDLDRRNGTNWASNLGFPADRDLEACVVEKNKQYSSVDIEDVINEDGDVYIDSNGTKLRILSKLSDVPSSSNASCDCGPSKLVKKDKGNKFLSSKKKKYIIQKQKLLDHCLYRQGSCSPMPDRVLNCPPYGQKNCYPRPDHFPGPKVNNGQQNKPEVYEDVTQPRTAYDQMKSDDFGMIKCWVGSKRTGLRKKINLEHESRHPDKFKKNLRIKSGMLSLGGDTLVTRNSASKSLISSDKNPVLATESHKRKKNLLCNNPHDGCIEQPCSRKRPGISLLRAQDCRDKNNHLEFSKFNVKQSRTDSPSVHERHIDPPNGVENHVSSRNDKKMGINVPPAVNNDSSLFSSSMSQHHTSSSLGKTSLSHAIPSGSKKFSSLRKKLLSVRHASVPESKKKMQRKHLYCKKRRLRENEAQIYRQVNLVETLGENEARIGKASSKSLINKTRVLKIQKKREGFMNAGKGDVPLKGLETLPKSDSHGGVEKNIDTFTGGNFRVDTYNVEIQDEFVCEPSYKIADGEAFVAFSNSLDSAFPGPTCPNVATCVSKHYGEREMFCADEVGKDLVIHNSHEVAEMNTCEAQRNYYVDVDPIPIPGPPGSFLPSPGRMGLEELQGNSSLTTCRIQSSEDERDVFDMDSSDSPISAMSVVSNLFAPISMQSHVRKMLPEKKPTPEPEEIATKSPMGYARSLVSNNLEAIVTACGDCESPTPSTSIPVLRLMGKNLMVVNKDENWSPQTSLITQSSIAMIENPGPWSCFDNGLSTSNNNIHNEPHSFQCILSRDLSILENMQTSMPAQHFDCNSSEYGFKVATNFKSVHPSTVVLSSKSLGGNFTSSLKPREYASGCNLIISNEIGSNIRLNTRTTYDNMERVRTPIPHVDSWGSKQKEIIVIDDSA